ncbi:MAG: 3-oxoadipyl-CoA thiolase, partial [Mollicutes bacterium]|nr:3-oxoadipyl-CoA thiolase [Mollicutes bacterium]
MRTAYICDAIRTPVGKYGGSLSSVRADDLAALAIKTLISRNNNLNPNEIDQVILGCSNQAGEDNRNVARMSLLLAGIPHTVPGLTVNRLCGS